MWVAFFFIRRRIKDILLGIVVSPSVFIMKSI
jgi:hypothetical protein